MAKSITQDSDSAQYWGLVRRLERLEQSVINAPHARVYNSAAQSIVSGTTTVLAFDSTRFDSADLKTSSTRLTATADGLYVVGAMISWTANATGYRFVNLLLNGLNTIAFDSRPTAGTALGTVCHVNGVQQLSASDYVEVQAGQNSGINVTVSASTAITAQYGCEFWMVQI